MSYDEWVELFATKHKAIVDKLLLKGYDQDMIIDYFDYENMQKNETTFCPLYKDNKKCHNIDELNCYLCGCPNFRFNSNGLGSYGNYKIVSKCSINNGSTKGINGAIHQDCSKCSVPHHKAYVRKHFNYNWREIMKNSKEENITIWYNKKCSKCNEALELLDGCNLNVVNYLEDKITKDDIKNILKKLNISPRELIRSSEELYEQLGLKNVTNDEELIDFMLKYPSLIQRPIIIKDDKAIIGRPPTLVVEFIKRYSV